MGRTLAFVGNCQLGALADLYRKVAERPEDTVFHMPAHEELDDCQWAIVANADVLVQQVFDFAPKARFLTARGEMHFVPHVTAAFLWPCAGQAHPLNSPHPHIDPSGPYPAELGDAYLNRMIHSSVSPEKAVDRYMRADIASLRNVGRMHELVTYKQRKRDEACGYRFSDYIEERFRSQPLFRTPNHPAPALTRFYAEEVFRRLGLSGDIGARLRSVPDNQMFPPSELPIHPAIISFFGLSYASDETRYRYFDEGRFTITEYANRYMNYEWNPLLAEAFHIASSGTDDDVAIAVLKHAIARSPRSAVGHSVLGGLLWKTGRLGQALDHVKMAVGLEPEVQHFRFQLECIGQIYQ